MSAAFVRVTARGYEVELTYEHVPFVSLFSANDGEPLDLEIHVPGGINYPAGSIVSDETVFEIERLARAALDAHHAEEARAIEEAA